MTLIYVIAMFFFIYLSYGAGAVQNSAVLVFLYILGSFVMGLLAMSSSFDNRKKKSIDQATEALKDLSFKICQNKKEEKENEAIADR